MSLFNLREWWRHQQGGGTEEFDQTSLCIGNVDNSAKGRSKVVTGSFSGVLRILQPSSATFSPSHILLEQQLAEPILQVALGCFVSGTAEALAVLHPRGLVLYQVMQPGGGGDDVPFLETRQLHSHLIPHTAANMVHGRFGGSLDVEAILVQAYDGQIYIFEGGQQVHVTFLDDFLVPGPLLYMPESDQVITCSSAYELQSYAYSTIVQSSKTKADASASLGPGFDLNQRKPPRPTWSIVLGELAVDLQLAGGGGGAEKAQIVVVGERTIVICSQDGQLITQRRLDYHPAAAVCYQLPTGGHNLIVATHTCNLLIYSGDRVVWLAKGPTVPVAIRVAQIGPLQAALVILDDEGLLTVCYLGTAPPASVLGLTEGREPDWDAVQARRKVLARIIRDRGEGGAAPVAPLAQAQPRAELSVRSQVPSTVGEVTERIGGFSIEEAVRESSCTVRVYVSNTGEADAAEVSLCLQTSAPVALEDTSVHVGAVRAGSSTPVVVKLHFEGGQAAIPACTEVEVLASFLDADDGSPRCCHHTFQLPLALFVQMVPPLKSAAARLTLVLDSVPPPVLSLFEDVAQSSPQEGSSHANANSVVSFQYPNKEDCTILISKSNNKYRLQGTSYDALWLTMSELLARLHAYFGPEGVRMQLEEDVPVQWYQECIEGHFALRKDRQQLVCNLEQGAAQMRVIQKALLVRYKEDKPTDLASLPLLMEAAFEELTDMADAVLKVDAALVTARDSLARATRLTLCCLRCRCPSMTDAESAQYAAHLSPQVQCADEVGWEETTDAALVQLLRGKLARGSREQAAQPSLAGPLQQCGTLTKHVAIMLERVEELHAG